MRILRSVSVLFLQHIFAGIIWTLIAVCIPILPALLAQDDSAVLGTEFRLMIVRSIATLTGITCNQGL